MSEYSMLEPPAFTLTKVVRFGSMKGRITKFIGIFTVLLIKYSLALDDNTDLNYKVKLMK
jgi:hypothetical protein